jgi:precorrin-2 methylase
VVFACLGDLGDIDLYSTFTYLAQTLTLIPILFNIATVGANGIRP